MYIQFTKVWFKSKPVTNYLELVWLCFVSRPSWFNTNKNLFFCKKQISRSLQLLRVLCKKIFQFLFLFVLFLVGILLLSSRLRWFWAEHQWFTSLKWEQERTSQNRAIFKKFKELWDWIVFPSLSFTIRLENPHHTFNQSDVKVKNQLWHRHTFSRAKAVICVYIKCSLALWYFLLLQLALVFTLVS